MALRLLDNTFPPLQDKIVQPTGMLSEVWSRWFGRLPATLDAIPSIINTSSLTAQGASILATDFAGTILLEGVYRASFYARITRAATVSSSLTVIIGWTDGAVFQSYTAPALIGNTTATWATASIMLHTDAGQPVLYATTYASAGATTMQYALYLSLERIKV